MQTSMEITWRKRRTHHPNYHSWQGAKWHREWRIPPVSLRSYGCSGRGSRVYSTVKVDRQELVLVIPVSVEVSRDLKISIVTKGKEKKQGGKVMKKKNERRKHTQEKHNTFILYHFSWQGSKPGSFVRWFRKLLFCQNQWVSYFWGHVTDYITYC